MVLIEFDTSNKIAKVNIHSYKSDNIFTAIYSNVSTILKNDGEIVILGSSNPNGVRKPIFSTNEKNAYITYKH